MNGNILEQLSSGPVYAICGGIIAFVALVCILFLVRAWKAGIAIGLDRKKMKRAVTASASFSILPGIGILLGVIALSGSLGVPWPWLRLSVIGALHYETQVAAAAAEAAGLPELSGSVMTAPAFATIALLMSLCIMWGMILSALFNKRYLRRLHGREEKQPAERKTGFGDIAMAAMFIGMVSAYLGSYLGDFVSGEGLFSFRGSWTPLVVAAVSACAMALLTWLSEKKRMVWLDNFSIAASMLVGMLAAVVIGK